MMNNNLDITGQSEVRTRPGIMTRNRRCRTYMIGALCALRAFQLIDKR